METLNEFQVLAKQYIAMGFKLFPVHSVDEIGRCTCGDSQCGDAGKHPKTGNGLKDASSDLDRALEWFADARTNIGIVTGAASGITVIDIDVADGKGGAESWAALISEHAEPQTLLGVTGSGGMHLVFKYNSSLPTASNVLGKGIDVRNDGGYIVAPPSRHRKGGIYAWENWGTKLADLPAFLSKPIKKRGRPKKDDMYRGKYTIEQVKSMLEFVPPDDRDLWRSVGIVLGREFKLSQQAWDLYLEWSASWGGKEGRNHEKIMHEAFYEISQQRDSNKELTIGTVVHAAIEGGWAPKSGEVPTGHFFYYGPGNNYIYRPTVSFWIAAAVDAAVSPINENGKLSKASVWLQRNALITSMTKDPGIEEDLKDGYDCRDGELVEVKGACVFNAYRKPEVPPGDARLAKPFLDHVRKVFNKPGDAEQFLLYMAHRVQKPWEKPRFALLLAGDQGVGKDTAVEFCCPAIGHWNVASIDPSALESNFNEHAASVLVRISEAANLHDMNKWAFNEQSKVLIAGLPDNVSINPKYGHKYSVRMHCGVIITTNHLMTGLYIPQGDRRYDVIECATMNEMGWKTDEARAEYFTELWNWFIAGGYRHCATYLSELDISKFSAANGQRKTNAHKSVVMAGMTGDHWLLDALETMGSPTFVRADVIVKHCETQGMKPHEIRAKLSNGLGRIGYSVVRNPDRADGRWKFVNGLTMVYGNGDISEFLHAKLEFQTIESF